MPNNVDVAVLPSAARTVSTNSADFPNIECRGIIVILDVTAASGTGGLQVLVQVKDVLTANYQALNATPAAVVATGTKTYIVYPGVGAAAGDVTQSTSQVVGRTYRIRVVAGDASSYTYSVSANLMV